MSPPLGGCPPPPGGQGPVRLGWPPGTPGVPAAPPLGGVRWWGRAHWGDRTARGGVESAAHVAEGDLRCQRPPCLRVCPPTKRTPDYPSQLVQSLCFLDRRRGLAVTHLGVLQAVEKGSWVLEGRRRGRDPRGRGALAGPPRGDRRPRGGLRLRGGLSRCPLGGTGAVSRRDCRPRASRPVSLHDHNFLFSRVHQVLKSVSMIRHLLVPQGHGFRFRPTLGRDSVHTSIATKVPDVISGIRSALFPHGLVVSPGARRPGAATHSPGTPLGHDHPAGSAVQVDQVRKPDRFFGVPGPAVGRTRSQRISFLFHIWVDTHIYSDFTRTHC